MVLGIHRKWDGRERDSEEINTHWDVWQHHYKLTELPSFCFWLTSRFSSNSFVNFSQMYQHGFLFIFYCLFVVSVLRSHYIWSMEWKNVCVRLCQRNEKLSMINLSVLVTWRHSSIWICIVSRQRQLEECHCDWKCINQSKSDIWNEQSSYAIYTSNRWWMQGKIHFIPLNHRDRG